MALPTLGGRATAVYSLGRVEEAATGRQRWAVLAAGISLLVLLSLAGDLAAALLGIPIPGAIIALAAYLLLMALSPSLAAWTLPAARLFTRFIGALIVPAAVGLAAFAPFLADAMPKLVLVVVVSTLVTGVTTALLYAGFRR